MRKADLPPLLREWAEWDAQAETAGYSDSTTIWRATFAAFGGEFQSAPPRGVRVLEIDGALRRLHFAMNSLLADPEPDIHRPIKIVQDFYRHGPKIAGELYRQGKSALYGNVTVGEALILREINRI